MAEHDRKDEDASGDTQPIDPPVPDDQRYQLESDGRTPTDVGRTRGGGNLGHGQPDEVERETSEGTTADRPDRDEPTMPSKESSLKTKI